jgi:hypothetical protein
MIDLFDIAGYVAVHLEPDVEPSPRQIGFWCGLTYGHRWGRDRRPLPPNPYPLRTVGRVQWSEGYVIGYRLGCEQIEAAKKRCQELP